MSKMIFVNLPVNDVAKSTAFYNKLGFETNPQFSNESGSSLVVSENIFVMVLDKAKFADFSTKEIADTSKTTSAIICLSADSREEVDTLVDNAFAAGAQPAKDPQDHGFMYGRSFLDLDGHHWEVAYMDMSAMPS
ncbi:VOC family protein [Amycolatopsis sp. NPDC059657]|uniref:VOC family protein n=1 Tax=Amycolatopsis sp. NPDC059657 TaxID=3346899 RepID=UPI0036730430